MQKYVTSHVVNMDQSTTVRIIICYYSSTRENSARILDKCYLRVGRMVVSIPLLQRTVQPMLQDMHIAIFLFRHFLNFAKFVRSRAILSCLVRLILIISDKKLTRSLIKTSLNKEFQLMEKYLPINSPMRLSLASSRSVKNLLLSLIQCYSYLTVSTRLDSK